MSPRFAVAFLSLVGFGASLDARACTGIHCFHDGVALAGNNEDFWNPDTRMWFVPAEDGDLGRVYFGFANLFPQGGMNERGLFFDGFATGRVPVTTSIDRPRFQGNLIDQAMASCADVEEVVALFRRHNLDFLESAMLMFGDRQGDSVIIEGDRFLRKQGRDQVVTNFYQSHSEPSKYSCPRYLAAKRVLERADEVDVEVLKRALDASHQEGRAPTQYSNIYDLTRGIVYLYHFHNFNEVVVLDLAEELAKGPRVVEIASLFRKNSAYKRYREELERDIATYKKENRSRRFDRRKLPAFAGRYHLPRSRELLVACDGDRITVSVGGRDAVEILPHKDGEDRFFYIDFDGTTMFSFRRDDDGEVAGVAIEPPIGAAVDAPRDRDAQRNG